MAQRDEDNCEECSIEEKRDDYSESGPLFYAYARRTDSSWASRYLLTFASAAIADEWWALVRQEYPKAGVRSSPQLFSFEGDKFPQKTANDKKFEHLTTKWFYSQIGDSDGTGGRLQDVIPLQASDGTVLTGGSSSSGSSSGFGSFFQNALQTMQSLMEGNNSQIRTLIDIQSDNNERFARMERAVEENAKQQIKTLSQGQSSDNQSQTVKELLQQNQEQLKTLANGQAKLREALEQSAKVSADMVTELKKQRHQNKNQAPEKRAECPHNVHPPPRKIDKPVVGYDYGKSSTTEGKTASAK